MAQFIKVIVGSQNPVKVQAAEVTFRQFYPKANIECYGVKAPSGVADQPMTEAETLLGAENRVHYCQQQHQADYYVAMEGGVDKFDYGAATFAYVVIADRQNKSIGRGANLPLPESVYNALESGQELGDVMDQLFDTENVKQKGGAIGLLTDNQATRQSNYTHALTLAMAPFLHPKLYTD